MLEITYTSDALKDLKKIGSVGATKVMAKVEAYAANPSAYASQVKRLSGVDALRLRIGDYRVLFTPEGTILHVLRIGHRREVYR